jgi:hypothetical protein
MPNAKLNRYYKVIITSLVLLSMHSVYAKRKTTLAPLLRCLAQEELAFHQKKINGPLFRLNQLFINDMASFGGAKLKLKYKDQVCRNSMRVSTEFLKILVLKGRSAFLVNTNDANLFRKASLQSLLERAPHIFFSYISDIQSLFASPHCLEKELPEIPYYIYRFKYLQNDIKSHQLLDDNKKVKRIFSKLEKIGPLLDQCKREFAKELKNHRR